MGKTALIREEWPSIPGFGGETKVYTVKVVREFKDYIIGKRHWYSRRHIYVKNGMFVRVVEIANDTDAIRRGM